MTPGSHMLSPPRLSGLTSSGCERWEVHVTLVKTSADIHQTHAAQSTRSLPVRKDDSGETEPLYFSQIAVFR